MNVESNQTLRRLAAALAGVVHPQTGDDVVSSGRVRDLLKRCRLDEVLELATDTAEAVAKL